ncbi:hypothetical protein D3C72_1126460 [compost metagenome]
MLVGPGAGGGDGGVADAARHLAEDARRRGGGGQTALPVQHAAADGAVAEHARRMIVLALAGPGEPGLFVADGLQPLIMGEQGGAFAGQHDVGGAVHHGAGGDDRVAEALQGGHGPGLAARAVHQAGVQLIGPGQVGRGAATGDIEAGVFQHDHGLDRHVHGGGPGVQPRLHRLDHLAHVNHLGVVVALASGAGAAVEDEGGSRHGRLLKVRSASLHRAAR